MRKDVIQGCFVGVQMRSVAPAAGLRLPAPVPAGRPAGVAPPVLQRQASAGPQGGSGSFAVNPMQIGLAVGGGQPLPGPILAKMEAAFRADFSSVRVHVGPQAARIGAIAFTMADHLYFSPGAYQPDSLRGQQLIGHELAHVIQQRQGRVRAPGPGVSVVRDAALEAEADRLGMLAAAHAGLAVQRRAAPPAGVKWPAPPLPPKVLQRAKRGDSDDEDWEPRKKSGKQLRGSFTSGQPEAVIKASAHQRKPANIDTTKYSKVWTCMACARPLAYETVGGKFELVQYTYVSAKNKHVKTQRAMEIDHHPEKWSDVLAALGKAPTSDALNDAYRDPTNLRALCRVCNGSHEFEGEDVSDYDSDDSSGPGAPPTPPHEPYNAGRWSAFNK